MIKRLFGDKRFLATFFTLAVPLALQNMITTGVNFIDTVMVGQLGDVNITAVGHANQVFFLFILILFGVCSGSAIFSAQFWGKGDVAAVRRVLGITCIASLVTALAFAVPALLFPRLIMKIYSDDPMVIKTGGEYLRVVCGGYVFCALTMSFGFTLKSMERTAIPLIVAAVSIIVNTILNYLLIFGKMGFPQMLTNGAAVATLIARAVEMLLTVGITLVVHPDLRGRISDYAKVKAEFLKSFVKTCTPVVLNEGCWALGTTTYSIIYSRMGDSPQQGTGIVAAMYIAMLLERFASVFIFGVGHAAGIMTGKEIGAKNAHNLQEYTTRFAFFSFCSGILFGAIVLAVAPFLPSAFNVAPKTGATVINLSLIIGLLLFIKNYNFVMITGVLRGGGDTRFCFIADTIGIFCSLPLVWFLGIYLKLPIEIVFLSTYFEESIKLLLIRFRLKKQGWHKDLVNI